ncbi:hypothetical protein [Haladaptatus sp.]|uniref:hypothetical protein n=1 Tax=Haladaptatus sp. TaxID=1973141 RepID=UPI003C408701
MSRTRRTSLNRRTFLRTAAGIAVGVGVGGVATASADGAGDNLIQTGHVTDSKYVLQQGDTCVPLAVITSDLPVEKFYNYRSSDTDPKGWYSSYGPASALERAETSELYLYRGPKGTSLVFMHGKRGSDGGGSVTFHISGLPDDGEWAVADDQYNASTNYDTFQKTDDEWDVDWTWASDAKHGGGADGGAFRGLTPDDSVTIHPAFNEAARLYGQHLERDYAGKVENWRALAADSEGSRWASLNMTKPVVIHAGQCGGSGGGSGTGTTTTKSTTTTSTDTATGTTTTTNTNTASETTEKSAGNDSVNQTAASGPGTQTSSPVGQDGLGVMTALSGILGTGLYLFRSRNEE